MAHVWYPPDDTNVISLLKSEGTSIWEYLFNPQQFKLVDELIAHVWYAPDETYVISCE